MPKNAVPDWSTTAADNSDIGGIALGENVAAIREMNDALREMMKQVAVQYKTPTGPAGVAVSAAEIDCSQGVVFTKTASGALSWTFANVPAGFYAGLLKLTNGGTGTMTLPSGSTTPGGVALTLVASGTDWLAFWTPDGGTSWVWNVIASEVGAP